MTVPRHVDPTGRPDAAPPADPADRTAADRRARIAAIRQAEHRRVRRRRWRRAAVVAVAAVVTVAALVVATVARRPAGGREGGPETVRVQGEQVFGGLTGRHVSGPVDYPDLPNPPVGGDHDPVWQNADGDVYDRPIRPEHAVHSLEHGTVWLTYRGDTRPEVVDALARKVEGRPYRMMSPVPDQPGPIQLTAWGHQLTVETPTDPRIDEFFTTYVQGPQSPERGGPVRGGRADP